MITISCTNCKATLNMDEAFAGGVCRCQHCGAIQTVPSRLKETATPPTKSRTLYRNRSRSGTGTGLDELAEIVASSGALTGSGLRASARAALPPTSPPMFDAAKSRPRWPWLAGAGALLGGVFLAVILLSRPGPDADIAAGSFAGVPLRGRTIVYVIDRGGANQGTFGNVVGATFHSLATLGPERRFQIVFWNNGSDLAYPPLLPTFANTQNVLAARRALEDVGAFGASDITSAIRKAAAARPDEIVLTTAKGAELDEQFKQTVVDALSGSKSRIMAFAIGEDSEVLQDLARSTDGDYHLLPAARLRAIGR